MNKQYIYIIRSREHITTDEDIYKIGNSTRHIEYDGDEVYGMFPANNSAKSKASIIELFNVKYLPTGSSGSYKGNVEDMVKDIRNICKEHNSYCVGYAYDDPISIIENNSRLYKANIDTSGYLRKLCIEYDLPDHLYTINHILNNHDFWWIERHIKVDKMGKEYRHFNRISAEMYEYPFMRERYSELSYLNEIRESIRYKISRIFIYACESNNVVLAENLYNKYMELDYGRPICTDEEIMTTLNLCYDKKNTDVIDNIMPKFKCLEQVLSSLVLFREACKNDNLDLAEDIYKKYLRRTQYNNARLIVCRDGNLPMLKWLYYDMAVFNVRSENTRENARKYGHTEISEWLE